MEQTPHIGAFPAGLVLGMAVGLVLEAFGDPSFWILIGWPVLAVGVVRGGP